MFQIVHYGVTQGRANLQVSILEGLAAPAEIGIWQGVQMVADGRQSSGGVNLAVPSGVFANSGTRSIVRSIENTIHLAGFEHGQASFPGVSAELDPQPRYPFLYQPDQLHGCAGILQNLFGVTHVVGELGFILIGNMQDSFGNRRQGRSQE
jgi:hypothetical protein